MTRIIPAILLALFLTGCEPLPGTVTKPLPDKPVPVINLDKPTHSLMWASLADAVDRGDFKTYGDFTGTVKLLRTNLKLDDSKNSIVDEVVGNPNPTSAIDSGFGAKVRTLVDKTK